MPPIVSPADLTDNERRVLTQLLLNTIANDPFPLSPRIRTLHAVLAKLDRPPSAREPAPRRNAKATSTARATTPSRSGRG